MHNSWKGASLNYESLHHIQNCPAPKIRKKLAMVRLDQLLQFRPSYSQKLFKIAVYVDVERASVQRTTQLFKVSVFFILILLHSVKKKIA